MMGIYCSAENIRTFVEATCFQNNEGVIEKLDDL